jgi:hypothetical protein
VSESSHSIPSAGEDRRDLTAAGLALILDAEADEDVVDAVWALVSPEVFTHLSEGRGWSIEKTEAWLVEMGTAALGPTSRPGRGRGAGRS